MRTKTHGAPAPLALGAGLLMAAYVVHGQSVGPIRAESGSPTTVSDGQIGSAVMLHGRHLIQLAPTEPVTCTAADVGRSMARVLPYLQNPEPIMFTNAVYLTPLSEAMQLRRRADWLDERENAVIEFRAVLECLQGPTK